jgi:hypothetical protein
MAHTDLTGKTVTLCPANDTLAPDYRGRQGTVVADGDLIRPRVLLAGADHSRPIHRTHLIVTPTPGTIEVNPTDLFNRLVNAAIYASRIPRSQVTLREYREGRYESLFELFCELTGQDEETAATAVAEAMTAQIANSA